MNLTYRHNVNIYSLNDFLCLAAYANSTFDAICEKWCKNNNYTTYNQKDIVKSLKEKILEVLDDENEICVDIKKRLDNWLKPSAVFKNKKFLIGLGLYPEEDKQEHQEHLRWINTVRNSTFHSSDIPHDKKIILK